jgi:predicted ArsR family transcriptional regulator
MDSFEERLETTGALADDLRRRLYLFIRDRRRPVGRDEAAQAVGISRKLAAFHLDKLVERDLLTAHYMRLSGKTGPGAGRPSKVYEPSERDVSVSIPYRSYEVVGDILLDALESTPESGSPATAVKDAAFEQGEALGNRIRGDLRRRPISAGAQADIVAEILSERGYEPYRDEGGNIRLNNCPFHRLAQRSPELVCGLNYSFVDGLLGGLGVESLAASLDPRPGECCVQIQRGAIA